MYTKYTIVYKTLSHPYRVEIKINSTNEDLKVQKINSRDKTSALIRGKGSHMMPRKVVTEVMFILDKYCLSPISSMTGNSLMRVMTGKRLVGKRCLYQK